MMNKSKETPALAVHYRQRAAQERRRAESAPNSRDRALCLELAEIFEARALAPSD